MIEKIKIGGGNERKSTIEYEFKNKIDRKGEET